MEKSKHRPPTAHSPKTLPIPFVHRGLGDLDQFVTPGPGVTRAHRLLPRWPETRGTGPRLRRRCPAGTAGSGKAGRRPRVRPRQVAEASGCAIPRPRALRSRRGTGAFSGSVITMIQVDAPTSSNVLSSVACAKATIPVAKNHELAAVMNRPAAVTVRAHAGRSTRHRATGDPEDDEAERGDRAGGGAQREGIDLARGAGVEVHGDVADPAKTRQDTAHRERDRPGARCRCRCRCRTPRAVRAREDEPERWTWCASWCGVSCACHSDLNSVARPRQVLAPPTVARVIPPDGGPHQAARLLGSVGVRDRPTRVGTLASPGLTDTALGLGLAAAGGSRCVPSRRFGGLRHRRPRRLAGRPVRDDDGFLVLASPLPRRRVRSVHHGHVPGGGTVMGDEPAALRRALRHLQPGGTHRDQTLGRGPGVRPARYRGSLRPRGAVLPLRARTGLSGGDGVGLGARSRRRSPGTRGRPRSKGPGASRNGTRWCDANERYSRSGCEWPATCMTWCPAR